MEQSPKIEMKAPLKFKGVFACWGFPHKWAAQGIGKPDIFSCRLVQRQKLVGTRHFVLFFLTTTDIEFTPPYIGNISHRALQKQTQKGNMTVGSKEIQSRKDIGKRCLERVFGHLSIEKPFFCEMERASWIRKRTLKGACTNKKKKTQKQKQKQRKMRCL